MAAAARPEDTTRSSQEVAPMRPLAQHALLPTPAGDGSSLRSVARALDWSVASAVGSCRLRRRAEKVVQQPLHEWGPVKPAQGVLHLRVAQQVGEQHEIFNCS